MLRDKNQILDLKAATLELKKEIATLRETNQTLKVKNRKQQNEITKKDKQIEALLDPRKSHLMKKVLSERGASIVLNLQEKNKKLEKTLVERDSALSRLRSDLQTIKLYGSRATSKKKIGQKLGTGTKLDACTSYTGPCHEFGENSTARSTKSQNTSFFKLPFLENNEETLRYDSPRSDDFSPMVSATSIISATETNLQKEEANEGVTEAKDPFEDFSRQELVSIITNLKDKKTEELHQSETPDDLVPESPNIILARDELYSETPHKEIQQLQDYFLDMLNEVDQLKETISELKLEQMNTSIMLKQKDSSVGQLAVEMKNFKRSQSAFKASITGKRKMRSAPTLAKSKVNVYDYTKSDKKMINEQSKKLDKLKKVIKLPMSENVGLHSVKEDEIRRDTYNNLMEQMLQSTIRLRQLTHGDN